MFFCHGYKATIAHRDASRASRRDVGPTGVPGGQGCVGHGGGSGIGRETALAFGWAGSKVVVADRNAAAGEQTSRLINDTGGESAFVACDVSKASDVEARSKRCVEAYGRLDCAHNNAGISGSGGASTRPDG